MADFEKEPGRNPAEKPPEADQPKVAKAGKPSKKTDDTSTIARDPGLSVYRRLLEQSRDKKTIENSLLISLCCVFVLLFITFPELASQIIQAIDQDDDISEIPQQKIIEPKEEEPPQVEERFRQEQKEFSYTMPSVKAPTAQDVIVKVVERKERLDVHDANLDSLGFDDDVPDSAPYIVVAGPIEKPQFIPGAPKQYPQRARMLKKQGYVRLQVKISSAGETVDIRVLDEQPADFGFGEAAVKYFEKGRWKPAKQNGKPINAIFIFVFQFTLT